jgi:hypothetical protein
MLKPKGSAEYISLSRIPFVKINFNFFLANPDETFVPVNLLMDIYFKLRQIVEIIYLAIFDLSAC